MENKTYVESISVSGAYVEHAQYHSGVSADSVLGVGSTPREALADALYSLSEREEALVCAEPTAEEEFGTDADTMLAEEAIATEDRRPKYWLLQSSVTGCHPLTRENAPVFDSIEEARAALRGRALDLQSRGFGVSPIVDAIARDSYDIEEPDGCTMVPDEVGTLSIGDDEEECESENERRREESELQVYVELSLSIVGPDDYSDDGVPSEEDIARLDVVREHADRTEGARYNAWRSRYDTGNKPPEWSMLAPSDRQARAEHVRKDVAERIRGILCLAEDSADGRLGALERIANLLGAPMAYADAFGKVMLS